MQSIEASGTQLLCQHLNVWLAQQTKMVTRNATDREFGSVFLPSVDSRHTRNGVARGTIPGVLVIASVADRFLRMPQMNDKVRWPWVEPLKCPHMSAIYIK